MAAVVLEEIIRRYLDERERAFLVIEHTSVPRVVRRSDIHVEPAVVVEVEDGVGHVPLVPGNPTEVIRLETGGRVPGAVEYDIGGAVVDQQLAPVGAHAGPPVSDLSGEEIDISVVVDVGTEGRGAVATEPERFSSGAVIPVVLTHDLWVSDLVAPFGRWVVTTEACGKLVVLPGEVVVIGVAGAHGSVFEAHAPYLIDGALPEMIGSPPVRWRHQLRHSVAVEVARRGSPAMGMGEPSVEIVHARPSLGLEARVQRLVGESAFAIASEQPILNRPHPRGGLRDPQIDMTVSVVVDEGGPSG